MNRLWALLHWLGFHRWVTDSIEKFNVRPNGRSMISYDYEMKRHCSMCPETGIWDGCVIGSMGGQHRRYEATEQQKEEAKDFVRD